MFFEGSISSFSCIYEFKGYIRLDYFMNQFKIFDTSNRNKFLNKAKTTKTKRDDENKRNQSIVYVQKKIRAFLTAARFGNNQNPLLIRNLDKRDNLEYVVQFWQVPEYYSQILRNHLLHLTMRQLINGTPLNICGQNFIGLVLEPKSSNKDLSVRQYTYFIEHFYSQIGSDHLDLLARSLNFRKALQNTVSHDIHKLADIISQLKDYTLINELIQIYQQNLKHKNRLDIEQNQDEERILKTYYKVMQICWRLIEQKKIQNCILSLLALVLEKMKKYYSGLIMNKYRIDIEMIKSPELREEVEQIFKEKREWEQYQSHLYHLSKIVEYILNLFMSSNIKPVIQSLNIVIEVTKLTDCFVNIKISKEEFFNLLEMLDSKSFLCKEEQNFKYYELLFTIILLEKYLESLNDLQFMKAFQYDVERLGKCIKNYLIRFMKNLINFNNQHPVVKDVLEHSVLCMDSLYNKIFRTNLLKTSIFEDPSLRILQSNYNFTQYGNKTYFKELTNIIERSPYLLPIQTRFLMFKKIVHEDSRGEYHGGQNITVKRGNQWKDALKQLGKSSLKGRMRIRFINIFGLEEVGADAGGLTKEFLTRMFKIAFNPEHGLFVQNAKKQIMPNPEYEKIVEGQKSFEYEFVGKLLGKSLYENIMLGVKFAGPFLNLLISKKNTFDDLLQIDPDLYKSLTYIASMQEDVDELQLTFQYQDNFNKKIVNLLPGGDKIKVNKANKMEYLNLLINYRVNRSFQRQTRYIRKGLRSMIQQSWIKMFNYAELNYLISGTGVIDVRDWANHARVEGIADHQRLIQQFWDIVFDFTEEQKSLLLKFVTSCERPSFLGFKDLSPRFTIRIIQTKENPLPVSHTCSNVLDLPTYSSKEIMRDKILYAIKSGGGFEIA